MQPPLSTGRAASTDANVKFRQKDHLAMVKDVKTRDDRHIATTRVVEVWSADEQTLLGVLYPTPNGVKFVSKYITNHERLVVLDPAEPPAVVISLERT
jgi:hypothetical protein